LAYTLDEGLMLERKSRTRKKTENRIQESGVRSQESGVRSQESGVRSQESGVRSQESGVRIAEFSCILNNAPKSSDLLELFRAKYVDAGFCNS
jgi:hypothetical protein